MGFKEIRAKLWDLTVCDLAAKRRCRSRDHVVSRGLETAFLMYLWVVNQNFSPAALLPNRFSRDFEIYCLNCPKSAKIGLGGPRSSCTGTAPIFFLDNIFG
mgnify:CR=1 FL=1